jgi:hypothetical protein
VLAGYALLQVLVDFTRAPSREVWLGRVVVVGGVVAALALTRARRTVDDGS